MKLDVLSIGDATIDRFLFLDEVGAKSELRGDGSLLCIPYGEKLPVERIYHSVAGNACNNAVANARFGFKTGFIAQVGDDPNGEWIVKQLAAEGVDTTFVTKQKGTQTNASTVLSFKGERTILVYHAPRKYVLPKHMPHARMIYLTSTGPNHMRIANEIAHFVKKSGARLAFNPGTYQIKAGLEHLLPVLAVTDTLFVNKEEAARILAVHGSIEEHARALHAHGVRTVVITDGVRGSYVFDGTQMFHLGIPHTPVVERTGAGDSFASGFMAARLSGLSIQDAMRWGTANASSVVKQIGPQAGLLSIPQIKAFIKKYRIGVARIC